MVLRSLAAYSALLVYQFQYIQCYGSSDKARYINEVDEEFQYIQCYGSSDKAKRILEEKLIFQYIQCYGSSRAYFNFVIKKTEFQYIQCYGSSFCRSLDFQPYPNFNTSNVMVLQVLTVPSRKLK